MSRLLRLALLVVAIGLALPVAWPVGRLIWARLAPPEAVLAAFTRPDLTETAEDQLTDPLILAGRRVVPAVLHAIEDPAMPLRRYAIDFLGDGAFPEARAALEGILADSVEGDYFRGDALEALYHIDVTRARQLAQRYHERSAYLGQTARDVLADRSNRFPRRTLALAFWHVHE